MPRLQAGDSETLIVNPAFGLRVYLGEPLPLVEDELPAWFAELSEDAQSELTARLWGSLSRWLARQGAEEIQVDQRTSLFSRRPTPIRSRPFEVDGLLTLALTAESLAVLRRGKQLLFMQEEPDSTLVYAAAVDAQLESEVSQLRLYGPA